MAQPPTPPASGNKQQNQAHLPLEVIESSARPRVPSFDSHRATFGSTETLILQRECRICFQAEIAVAREEDGSNPSSQSSNQRRESKLIKPCLCRGTMAYVHEACMLRWLTEKRTRHCELCQYPLSVKSVFSSQKLLLQIWNDIKFLTARQDRLMKVSLQTICIVIYVKYFLPIVRFLRTKMLRDLCKLWMIFEQEEKLREAQGYSCKMKVRQVITQEIPITIKLMIFMWVLRKFVSIGGKYLLRIGYFLYKRWYSGSLQLKFFHDPQLRIIQRASLAAAAARVRAHSLDNR